MSKEQTFVIVGASLAGAKAAERLRPEGFDGRVVPVGEEPERPYERPPLSKDYLRGDAGRDADSSLAGVFVPFATKEDGRDARPLCRSRT